MHPLNTIIKISREAHERHLDSFGITKEYRKRIITEGFSAPVLQVKVKLTEDRAELTLVHSKPEPKRVCGGGLHDYRHYEGKENWDD
jgi:hypothetical protein